MVEGVGWQRCCTFMLRHKQVMPKIAKEPRARNAGQRNKMETARALAKVCAPFLKK